MVFENGRAFIAFTDYASQQRSFHEFEIFIRFLHNWKAGRDFNMLQIHWRITPVVLNTSVGIYFEQLLSPLTFEIQVGRLFLLFNWLQGSVTVLNLCVNARAPHKSKLVVWNVVAIGWPSAPFSAIHSLLWVLVSAGARLQTGRPTAANSGASSVLEWQRYIVDTKDFCVSLQYWVLCGCSWIILVAKLPQISTRQ